MTQQFKSWDQYSSEAKKTPFELPVSEDETIIIQPVSGAGMIQFARAYRAGDLEAMLIVMCGESWKQVEALLPTAGPEAMNNLMTDMMLHFDLAEEVILIGQGGGERIEKDPRKIRAMLNQGYRVKGEATSRI